MNTAKYVERYGRDGKLYCRQCGREKHGVKLQAVFLAHYVAAVLTIDYRDGSRENIFHTPLCLKHANRVDKRGLIGIEQIV